MNLEGAYDSTVLDLDQCLMENKNRHRSPIIHLPEIFMYGYEFKDVLECANNFKSCSLDKSDDPVVNTVKYYSQKYDGKINPESLNMILDAIYEHAYAIFHIAKDGTTYLASVKEGADDICIDSVCLQWNQMPDQNCDVQVAWSKNNKFMKYDEFAKSMFDKFHSEDYKMNNSLKKIMTINQDVKDRFDKMPYFSYAMEDTDDFAEFKDLDNDIFSINLDDLDAVKENEFVLSVATEAPGDEDESDGLSDLENMSGNKAKPAKRPNRSANPLGDLENITNDTPEEAENNQRAETTDDTSGAREVNVAQMTNDRMQDAGDTTSEAQVTGDDANGGDAPMPDEGGEEPTDDEANPDEEPAEDDGTDPSVADDTDTADNNEEENDEKLLNDPDAKEIYRKRFIALYKHINDVIDTLERFTPAYDVKCTNDYYTIQNDMYRLRTAIYKICTEKIKDMQTVDVMNAYLTANYAYDSIGEMLKEFFKHYRTERMHTKK